MGIHGVSAGDTHPPLGASLFVAFIMNPVFFTDFYESSEEPFWESRHL
jgi:hypothetical protein